MSAKIRSQLVLIASKHGVDLERLYEEWAERAAIREFLGDMSRARAEALAVRDACDALGLPQEEP